MAPVIEITVRRIPLTEIEPSSLNPRRHTFANMSDAKQREHLQPLADSLSVMGNLELITVRPHPTKPNCYELANGERRWRAALQAGVANLEARVMNLTDPQMLDMMLQGGGNQEPLSPMAEAHGYRERMAMQGLTQKELADHLGLPQQRISERLALLDLPSEAQKAVDGERLEPSTAILIAAVADPAQRANFAAEVMLPKVQDHPLSYRQAKALRDSKYCRSLKGVPFDAKDALLVPAVGSCTHCQHNHGGQCANVPCFEGKVAAARERLVAEYRKKGFEVLSPEDNAKAFPADHFALNYKTDWVEYQKPVPAHLLKPEVTPPKWTDLCHGPKAKLKVYVGFDQHGRAVELVRVGEAVCAADLNERAIFNEETRVRFGLENQGRHAAPVAEVKPEKKTKVLTVPIEELGIEPDEEPSPKVLGSPKLKDRALEWMLDLLKAHAPTLPEGFARKGWVIVGEAGLLPTGGEICEGCDAFIPESDEAATIDQDGLHFCASCSDAARKELAEIAKAHAKGMPLAEIARSYGWEIEDLCGALGVPVPAETLAKGGAR